MSDNLLQVQKISKSYGAKVLFDEASFSLNEKEHVGVIGANGAGKSTLFKGLIGRIELDSGDIIKRKGLKIGYLGQEEHEAPNQRVEDLVSAQITEPIWEVKRLGQGLGVEESHFQMDYNQLSGGFRMRVQLICLLGQAPDLLLLDEPTNYLDLESLIVLEKFLIDYKRTFLLISHDREFLKRTTDHTLEIEGGMTTKFAGNIEDYFEQKAQLCEILEKTARSVSDKRSEILKFAERFGAKASKAKQAQSKLKQLSKLTPVEVAPLQVAVKIKIPEPRRIGKQAISLQNTSFGYGKTEILRPFSFSFQKGDHVAVVGVNGAGKSTLLKGVAGSLKPFTGSIEYGHQVELGYYAQHVAEELRPTYTVMEEMLSAAADDILPQEVKDLAGSFLFSGDDIHKKVSVLSGGEKARVALAQILLKKCPVLLLDEPTNHLDFHSVEALTEALKNYSGTVVMVSHDRSFIGRIASKIVEIRDGCADLFPGTYDEYVWSLQKGTWSSKEVAKNSPPRTEKVTKNALVQPRKFNSKLEQKAHAKEQRRLEKEISRIDLELETRRNSIYEKNKEMVNLKGLEASRLAQEISKVQEELERLEEDWLIQQERLEKHSEAHKD